MTADLFRVLRLWLGRSGWLVAGIIVTVLSALAGVALLLMRRELAAGLGRGRMRCRHGLPPRGHGQNPVRMLGGQINRFRPILTEVVEFPSAVYAGCHDLPIPLSKGSVALMLPPEGFPLQIGVLSKGSDEAEPRRLRHFRGMILFWPVSSGQFQNRGDQINEMARRLSQRAPLADTPWPVHDEWRGDAPFVHPGLVTAERCVGQRRPTRADAEKRRPGSAQGIGLMSVAAHHHLCAGTIVRKEQNQRVLEVAHGLELLDDSADFLIHPIHHGCVDRHFVSLETALAAGEFRPRQWPVYLVGSQRFQGIGKVVGRPDFAFYRR